MKPPLALNVSRPLAGPSTNWAVSVWGVSTSVSLVRDSGSRYRESSVFSHRIRVIHGHRRIVEAGHRDSDRAGAGGAGLVLNLVGEGVGPATAINQGLKRSRTSRIISVSAVSIYGNCCAGGGRAGFRNRLSGPRQYPRPWPHPANRSQWESRPQWWCPHHAAAATGASFAPVTRDRHGRDVALHIMVVYGIGREGHSLCRADRPGYYELTVPGLSVKPPLALNVSRPLAGPSTNWAVSVWGVSTSVSLVMCSGSRYRRE